jgi:hypothetical protein
MARFNEKFAEEAIRSIYKEGAKTKSAEAEEFDSERKVMKDTIKVEAELSRLEQLCRNKNLDTRTRKEREREKSRRDVTPRHTRRRQEPSGLSPQTTKLSWPQPLDPNFRG